MICMNNKKKIVMKIKIKKIKINQDHSVIVYWMKQKKIKKKKK